ncbi:MAG: phosphatidate cytidylyltransferase [Acidobacteria bacterium]|nr:phosphatidate cytidylyltransferase [Acidobacteriota bacterium]
MTRLLSGAALGAAALAGILFLPSSVLRVVACLVAALAAREYVRIIDIARTGGASGAGRTTPGEVPLLLLVALTAWWLFDPGLDDLLSLLLLGLGWVAIEVVFRGLRIDQASARFFAALYLGLPLGLLAGTHALGGRTATLLLLATVVVSDTAQYYCGRLLGRHLLAPAISPKKTIEGAVGGFVVATMFITVAGGWALPLARPSRLALLGVVMVALGICGDLFESRLKRAAGMKDSAELIPGHGGVLDRIDALLFATPPFYLYLRAVV